MKPLLPDTLRVGVLLPDPADTLALIQAQLAQAGVAASSETIRFVSLTDAASERELAACQVLVGEPDAIRAQVHGAHAVRWIQSSFAGVEKLVGLSLPPGCVLTAIKSGFGTLISEYVFGYLIAHQRQFAALQAQQARAHWQPLAYTPLSDLTLTVFGTGDIGRQVATTARQFGMRVLGVNRSGANAGEFEAVFTADTMAQALAQSDVVVLALPATGHTCKLFAAPALAALKKGARLFNVGRGSVIDDDALLAALDSGHVAHAWLDVFEQEPLAADHPYWRHPSVTVTPHVAAVTTRDLLAGYFVQNLLRYLRGEPLAGRVDLARGY